jgi:hypothetical protein
MGINKWVFCPNHQVASTWDGSTPTFLQKFPTNTTSKKPLFGLSFGQFTDKLSWLGYAKSLDNCQILKIQRQDVKEEPLS